MKFRNSMYMHYKRCWWCGGFMILKPEIDNFTELSNMATVEHLQPQSESGSNFGYNLRLVHKRCNK